MKSEKDIPSDMLRSVHTVIWAAKRATVPELPKIAELLRDKYGGDLIKHAKENKHGHVDEKVMQRLSMNVSALRAKPVGMLDSPAAAFPDVQGAIHHGSCRRKRY